jgi:propanol-preferring alcohol dehydrogenase
MKAMILKKITDLKTNKEPLELIDMPKPMPKEDEILIKVSVCGVCHTELDEIEGRTPPPNFPIVLGHQVVGKIVEKGKNTHKYRLGDRVGVAWIFSSCGKCEYCLSGQENLCKDFKATGRDANGGYAEFMTVKEDFAYLIPDVFTDSQAAPLLCAGGVGYRSFKLTNITNGQTLGLTGFGASGHLVLKLVKHIYPKSKVFVFARSETERKFALELGADWAGDTADYSPEKCNAIIDTTPVWKPVVEALKNLKAGGRLVINAIRKEKYDKDYLFNLNYENHLWMEKEIKSVANVTRADVSEFLKIAAEIPLISEVTEFPLAEANKALLELKERKIRGAKVLRID